MSYPATLDVRAFADGEAAHQGPLLAGCGCAARTAASSGEQASNIDLQGGTLAENGKPIWTLSQVVASLLRWQEKWFDNTIVYSFLTSVPIGGDASYQLIPFTATERLFTRAAFDLISDIAPLDFVELPWDNASFQDSERIVFGGNGAAPEFEWGHARNGLFFRPGIDEIANSEIWINPDAVNVRQWIYGGANFKSLVHEILHAVGLPHPGNYNANGQPITYAQHAQYFQDTAQFTVMSYFGAEMGGADYEWTTQEIDSGIGYSNAGAGRYSPATPMVHDIAALQALYGANLSTRSDDTVYGYNSTAGRPSYDFAIAKAPIFTIWDGGGIDTLDLSLSPMPAKVDLNEGAYSDALAMTGNIGIAYGAKIENAKTGAGADFLLGNALANLLESGAGNDTLAGGAGDDTLVGGEGQDTVVYSGLGAANFRWTSNPDGSWTVEDTRAGRPEGIDKLVGVEFLQFSDQLVPLVIVGPALALNTAFQNILRYQPTSSADNAYINGLISQVGNGAMTLNEAIGQLVDRADNTTAVASLSYQFFTGATPSSGGLDYLVSPTGGNPNNLNSPYYQAFSIDNRFINFAVNLGAGGEGRAAFQAEYGSRTLFEATKAAYTEIFGSAPTDQKVGELLDSTVISNGQSSTRAQYLAIYGGDGVEGLGTKAAMVGWLLAVAAIDDVGAYGLSNEAYLTDLADGAGFAIDLVGVYGRPEYVFAG